MFYQFIYYHCLSTALSCDTVIVCQLHSHVEISTYVIYRLISHHLRLITNYSSRQIKQGDQIKLLEHFCNFVDFWLARKGKLVIIVSLVSHIQWMSKYAICFSISFSSKHDFLCVFISLYPSRHCMSTAPYKTSGQGGQHLSLSLAMGCHACYGIISKSLPTGSLWEAIATHSSLLALRWLLLTCEELGTRNLVLEEQHSTCFPMCQMNE